MNSTNNRWFSLFVLLSAPLLSVIDVFIINMAVPSIKKGIHATPAGIQLVIAGYLLGFAGFLITGGRAGDIFGRKKVFLLGMFCFTLTSCLCGMAETPTQLIITRFFQGVSAAFMAPQTIAYIQVLFPESSDRTKALGFFGLTISLAAMSGQLLGGFLPGYHGFIEGWRLIFFINLPIGIVALLFAYRSLRETPVNRHQQFDYSGVVMLTVILFALIYPLIQGRETGWPWWSFALMTFSFILLWYFVKDQKEKLKDGLSPLINFKLFAFRDFNLGLIALTFYFMVHTSYLLIFTVYLQEGLGMTPSRAGSTFVFFDLGSAISAVTSVRLYIRYGKKVLLFGTFITIAALIVEFTGFDLDVSWPVIVITILVQGLGTGIIIPSLLNVTLKNIPLEYSGTAAGVFNTIQQTASALGISLIGGLFFFKLEDNAPVLFFQAFRSSLAAQIACLFAVGVLLYLIPEKKRPTLL